MHLCAPERRLGFGARRTGTGILERSDYQQLQSTWRSKTKDSAEHNEEDSVSVEQLYGDLRLHPKIIPRKSIAKGDSFAERLLRQNRQEEDRIYKVREDLKTAKMRRIDEMRKKKRDHDAWRLRMLSSGKTAASLLKQKAKAAAERKAALARAEERAKQADEAWRSLNNLTLAQKQKLAQKALHDKRRREREAELRKKIEEEDAKLLQEYEEQAEIEAAKKAKWEKENMERKRQADELQAITKYYSESGCKYVGKNDHILNACCIVANLFACRRI